MYKKDPNSYPTDDLVFVGMISLVDPPKEGVDGAIDDCRDAYVKVTMVTGDHPLTAEAIARKVGIITLPTAREVAAEDGVAEQDIPLSDPRVQAAVVPGSAIPSLSEEQWVTLLSKEEVVFARTSPQQKLQIVDHYQKMGHVVAVTGDGTNDSPALKKAQIGVSMGSAMASDVAREVSSMRYFVCEYYVCNAVITQLLMFAYCHDARTTHTRFRSCRQLIFYYWMITSCLSLVPSKWGACALIICVRP